MTRYIVTLASAHGTLDVPVSAPDEWIARQLAIRSNTGRGYWCSAVSAGILLDNTTPKA